jgi:hypothetical protein
MAAASQSKELAKDLPEVLIQNLENGPYGRDYLAGISAQFKKHYR